MFIFPIIYIVAFLMTIREFLKGKKQAFFIFLIFGLSIYTTAMSVTFKLGFSSSIGFLQSFKELLVIGLLSWSVYDLKEKVKFHFIDYAILAYFTYTFLYVILPIGENGMMDKVFAFKSSSFFVLVYFAGRLVDPVKLFINKYFLYILILAVAAAAVVLFEVITNQHLQTRTGYADYNFYFFNFEPSGNYGLSWTFESASGFKRFASFFANPLEHAAATLISLAVLAAFYTNDQYKFKPDNFGVLALSATFISILFAVSRSSFASYFILIYAYGWITNKKYIPKLAHTAFFLAAVYIIYLLSKDLDRNSNLLEVIVNTLDFSDSSSVGHLLEWIQGINAIYLNPLGLGLGSSGRVAGTLGENIGGENQFIIIGVQVGLVALAIYIAIYASIIKNAKYWYYRLEGKEKKVCLTILLIKISFIIPLFTSEIETSSYISYMIWFLTGIFVNIISRKLKSPDVEKVNNRG